MEEHKHRKAPKSIEELKADVYRPHKAVVTAGMPYANGQVHIGHLAGCHIPADIYARWLRMLIGKENVLFVCGTDDHGSTSEVAALQANQDIHSFITSVHDKQEATMTRYGISLDVYSGTSRSDCFPTHKEIAHDFMHRMYRNGLLQKRTSRQWYDPKIARFLQDRFVRGRCPNPKCTNEAAYSDECDVCGGHHDPAELTNPRSALSDATPELRETAHWWLDMWQVSETLRTWIESRRDFWRKPVFQEVHSTVLPCLRFSNVHEGRYKELKDTLPPHKSRYAAGKKVVLQFDKKAELELARGQLIANAFDVELVDGWAHRAITRDVSWGIPVPRDIDAEMIGKTLYVWPDSLIAPISFTRVALARQGRSPEEYAAFWRDPDARIYQFLGQDNVFFYILMQGAMWLGTQADPQELPGEGDYQMTDIFGCFHLLVNGEKMSKSKGNYFTGDQLLDDHGLTADQVRYFLALLSLPEKPSNFDFATLHERNKFLAGPLNAAFEKPIAAAHSKFGGRIPEGTILEKVATETRSMIERYLRSMERAEYSTLLFAIENYARQINSLFTQHKPHDDRFPEQARRDALYSSFYVLKNIMIMLYPFVPETMERLRQSLRLDPCVFQVQELGIPISGGHVLGEKQQFFPLTSEGLNAAT